MTPADLPEVLALWRSCEGLGLGPGDSIGELEAFLERNPRMSFVVRSGGSLAGAVVSGHDGRRGYLHHLAVAPASRRRGIGSALVAAVEGALARAGVGKCHLFVKRSNPGAAAFWNSVGWGERLDLQMFSREL